MWTFFDARLFSSAEKIFSVIELCCFLFGNRFLVYISVAKHLYTCSAIANLVCLLTYFVSFVEGYWLLHSLPLPMIVALLSNFSCRDYANSAFVDISDLEVNWFQRTLKFSHAYHADAAQTFFNQGINIWGSHTSSQCRGDLCPEYILSRAIMMEALWQDNSQGNNQGKA